MYVIENNLKGYLVDGEFINSLEAYTYNNAMQWVKHVASKVPIVQDIVTSIRPEAFERETLKISLQMQIINEVERYLTSIGERV